MSKYAIPLVLIFLNITTLSLYAQEYVFDYDYINTDEGLPNNEVFNIIQDENGYIWVNTPGAISKYNGYTFQSYSDTLLNIKASSAVTFAFDQAGNLWYNEQNEDEDQLFTGILYPQTGKVTSVKEYTKGQITSQEITYISSSNATPQTVCIVTKTGEVFLFGQALEKVYQHESSLSFIAGHQVEEDRYWLLDEGQAIIAMPAQAYMDEHTLPFYRLKLISHTPEVIIEIQENPARYVQFQQIDKEKTFVSLTPELEGVQEPIKILAADKYLLYYSPHKLQLNYKGSRDLVSPSTLIRPCDNCRLELNSATTDAQDNLWLGTQEGIIKISPIKKNYGILERRKSIESIEQWGNKLWIGEVTRNTQLDLSASSRKSFLRKERVKVAAYSKDHKNQLWVAANDKIYAYAQNGERLSAHPLKGNNAKTLHFDKINQQLFIGTNVGLEQFDIEADTFKTTTTPLDSTNIEIRQIYQNDKGLGVVTDSGLFVLNPATLEQTLHLTTSNGLPTDNLWYAYEDKASVLWIATKGVGLVKWDTKTNKVEEVITNNNWSNNTVYAIYEDDFNNLWLPSQNGLFCLDKETLSAEIYNSEDHIHFKPYAHHQAEDGTLYFGGENGIIKRHPADLFIKDTTSSLFHLEKVAIQSNDSDQGENRTASVLANNEIIFSPSDQSAEIYFSLMDYKNLQSNVYSYRIEGYQNQWTETKENKIALPKPPYGNYTLQIKAKGVKNAWSKDQIEIPIHVETPFYRQWWFQLLVLSLGGFLIYLGSRWRIRALERDKERLEAEVLKRTQKIEEDKEIINAQKEDLKALDKAKTRFFSNITHEYRTPLTLIMGRTEQLLETSTDQLDERKLNSIKGSANNLLGLVNQLLDLSKLEGGRMKIDVYHGDLIGYTEELVYRFKPLATQKNLELVQTSKRKVWKTYFDKEKWDRIIINLMSNAIKFTPEGGSVKVHIKSSKVNDKNFISLEVKDTGQGIAQEQIDKIFERFHQVDGSSTKIQQGTGIGLSLVHELVKMQGGEINVTSQLNKGTSFAVTLPILQATENAKKLELSNAIIPMILESELSHGSAKTKKKKKGNLDLLIIEDNHEMRNYISQCIDASKYNILEAVNGEDGIQKALENIPDLIISDVMMPKKNGYEVTETLRKNISTSHIPIVLLTAKASLASKLEGLKRGADAYLTKPFSPEELGIRVNKLIELRQQLQSRYDDQQLTPTSPPSNTDSPDTKGYKQEDEFVSSVKEYILSNLQDSQLNGDMIGRNFGMSRMQLHRKLKALLNLPVGDIIRNIRLERAAQLLKEQQLNISEVAYETGFSSPSTFSRVFKDKQGVSPSEFKSKHTQSV